METHIVVERMEEAIDQGSTKICSQNDVPIPQRIDIIFLHCIPVHLGISIEVIDCGANQSHWQVHQNTTQKVYHNGVSNLAILGKGRFVHIEFQ